MKIPLGYLEWSDLCPTLCSGSRKIAPQKQ